MGQIASRVSKSETASPDFSVKTPTATAAVRGTHFTVGYDQRSLSTTVLVDEGVVQVTPENSSLRSFSLRPGQQAQVTRNNVGPVTPVIAKGGGASGGGSRLTVEQNTDRPGGDYKNFDLTQAGYEPCSAACANDPHCTAYTYVKPGVQGPSARCWLKSGLPAPAGSNSCCISGVKRGGGEEQWGDWQSLKGLKRGAASKTKARLAAMAYLGFPPVGIMRLRPKPVE